MSILASLAKAYDRMPDAPASATPRRRSALSFRSMTTERSPA